MNKLKSQQKEKVRQFITFTQTTESIAISCLSNANWNLEMACDIYYQNPAYFATPASNSPSDVKKVEQFFNKYANDPSDKVEGRRIGPNGMLRLLNDLGVDPSSREVLILAWKLKAGTQCEFSWEEWKDGMTALKVDSLDKLKAKMPKLNDEIKDQTAFRNFYQFTFQYAKAVAQRSLDLETAVAYWQLVFAGSDPRVDTWVDFLRANSVKGIPKDTWNLFLDFLYNVKPDCSNYDSSSAWPVLLDEFVDYIKARQK
ncbi:RP42 protein [Aphelenchoides avenae]|nr:RP42 protein [Aphelenchus avenae]